MKILLNLYKQRFELHFMQAILKHIQSYTISIIIGW
jgi:hypothetical protein